MTDTIYINLIYYKEIFLIFICGCLMSAMLIPKISLVSFRRRLFDRIDARKIHHARIPRLGGIAFFPCISVAVSFVIVCHNLRYGFNILDLMSTTRLLTLFSSLFVLYLMGIMDDLIGVRYRSKFIIQILCGTLMVASGFFFNNLYGLFGIYEIPGWIGMPFTVFIIVYILNAINLIDGIDGLAAGLGMIAFFAFGSIYIYLHWWLYAFISFAALGVLIPFFYYNVFGQVRRGRKIFMGDTGSLTIGMLLAILAIRLSIFDPIKEGIFAGSIIIAFSFLIVPMLDVVRVVIHRLRCGKSPFLPDQNHIHHKFMALGFSQHQALISITGIALFYVVLNLCLIHHLSTTMLFLLDMVIWTAMHIGITVKINKKSNSEKQIDQQK